jgi:hypothetical protein
MGSTKPGFPRPPRHLKLPTQPGEHSARALYNTVGDFFALIWGLLRLDYVLVLRKYYDRNRYFEVERKP